MLSLPSFFAALTSAASPALLPCSGGASPARLMPNAVLALPMIVRPNAAAALRRSIDDRLMPSSESFAQNSTSWAS